MATEESSNGHVPPVRQGSNRRGELPPVHTEGKEAEAGTDSFDLIRKARIDAFQRASQILATYCEVNPEYWTKAYNDLMAEIISLEEE